MKKKTIITISSILIILLIIASIFFYSQSQTPSTSSSTKSSSSTQSTSKPSYNYEPLTDTEKAIVYKTITESEFYQDIPEKYPISLTFFKFSEGQRIWQDGFLMANGELLSEGNPGIKLTLHSKYIEELQTNDLCSTIQTANKNKDLGFESEYGTASLLIKYSGILEHRSCFGF